MEKKQNKQSPAECAHFAPNNIHCAAHYERNGDNIWVYPCLLLDDSIKSCRDFKPRNPSDCTHYGCGGSCHEHSIKKGGVHVSVNCKADSGEPCKDFITNPTKQ